MTANLATLSGSADVPEAFSPSAEVRAGMDTLARGKVLPRGTVLFRQGEAPRGVWVMHRGRARLVLRSDAGQARSFRTVGPGYVLGLPATILNVPYLFTAQLAQRSEVAFVERGELLHFLRRRADLCFDVVQQLGGDLVDLHGNGRSPRRKRARSNA